MTGKASFAKHVRLLISCASSYDPGSLHTRKACLQSLLSSDIRAGKDLERLYDQLLFLLAYPADAAELRTVKSLLNKISSFLRQNKKTTALQYQNKGLPFSPIVTRFTHDAVRWLLQQQGMKVSLDSFADGGVPLNEILKITLTPLERSETTAGLDNYALLETLGVPPSKHLPFIIEELSRLDQTPLIKDHLFDQLGLYIKLQPTTGAFSKATNGIRPKQLYFHQTLEKRIDIEGLLHSPLPQAESPGVNEKEELIRVIKNTMILQVRETDPTTYMDESTLRLYHLERGVSVALYTMVFERQLALESYVGYTAFKNGYPVAYGGAWVFGHRANFGINIFPSYRSGESAYVMAQLLRVYRSVFELKWIEVEPYQIGYDNPDGIASGAFWFYYRFGFRPSDPDLLRLAQLEASKIQSRKGYRTSARTLRKLAESAVVLKWGQDVPLSLPDITASVTKMIQKTYGGQRKKAEEACRQKFLVLSGWDVKLSAQQDIVLTDVSLWMQAMHMHTSSQLSLLKEMIITRPHDVYAYQRLLRIFFMTGDKEQSSNVNYILT